MVKELTWKEGAIADLALDDMGPRPMRVVRVRRTGPNTTDVTLEAVPGPDVIVEPIWKEGAVISVTLESETRTMRVVGGMAHGVDYGTCEGCGGNVAEHCIEDATDCIANWPAAGSTPEQRERIHASLCSAPDYGAALALYWWMHLASEHFYGESWPFQWEDKLRAWIENGLPAGTREPYAGWREEGQRLYAAAGGQWCDASDGRLFVRAEGT